MAKKILYLIESLGSGGAEAALYTCLRFLDRNRFDAIVCPLHAAQDHWWDAIESLHYKIVTPTLRGRWDWERGIRELPLLLINEGIDLIHTHLYDANLYGRILGRSLSLPVVTSLHSPDYEPEVWKEDSGQSWLKSNLFRLLDKHTGRQWCAKWIAVSKFVKLSAVNRLGIPPDKIEIINNSIDFQRFPGFDPVRRHTVRQRLGFAEDDLLLLFIARMHPPKGHRHLISAMRHVAIEYEKAHLLLVGTGAKSYEEELRNQASSLGVGDRIEFLGPRRDIDDLLVACDLFVFPSLYEGFGIALLEALAMECACVASRIDPIEELIANGKSGILVDPRNHDELAAAISRLLSDPEERRRLGKSGRMMVESRFEIRKNIKLLEQFYEKVLEEWAGT